MERAVQVLALSCNDTEQTLRCDDTKQTLSCNDTKQTSSSSDIKQEVFPAFLPNLDSKPGIKAMDIISNLEDVKNLEFNSEYITDMIEKFGVTPLLCNKCNDLSKHFMNPEFYINELYVRNAKWVPKEDSIISMEIPPYDKLTVPIFDV